MKERKNPIFNSIAPDFSLYTLRCQGMMLSEEQKNLFHQAMLDIQRACGRIIYRGENKLLMASRYGVPGRGDSPEFADRIFLFGNKGRHFWQEVTNQQQGLPSRLEDHSDAYLLEIFDMIGGLFNLRRFSLKVQQRIDQFKLREIDTVAFFTQSANRLSFIGALNNLTDRERIRIRDYYLTLLHHLGESDYYPISFLVSTTRSWRIAQNFSKKAREEGNDMIFMGWVPPRRGYTLSSHSFLPWRQRPDLLDRIGLPHYRSFFFHYQQEVTLRGAWFPHYILAYFHSVAGELRAEINPYLFVPLTEKWTIEGLPIDQHRFHEELPNTGYGRAGLLLSDNGILREI